TSKNRFFSRVLKILVQPVSDLGVYKCSSSIEFGYVMVYTMYSIHWYCVKYDESRGRPVLTFGYLGGKQFKSCSIASASWSPHLPGESLVLLENGEVFIKAVSFMFCTTSASENIATVNVAIRIGLVEFELRLIEGTSREDFERDDVEREDHVDHVQPVPMPLQIVPLQWSNPTLPSL
ncbi:unnamed protein product, partial [Thlaspi arvense]